MAKSLQTDVESILNPFRAAIGQEKFPVVCNQVAAFLGRQQVTTLDGDWECSAKCKLSSKDKNTMQLPLNDARSILIRFGLNIGALAKAGEFTANVGIPKACEAWIDKVELPAKQDKKEPAKA